MSGDVRFVNKEMAEECNKPTLKSDESQRKKFVIDNDAGGDDAMAIFLALLYEKYYDGPKLVGLTTGNGNTIEENVYVNNQKILKVAERQDVPIYRGSKSSILNTLPIDAYYGNDGLGDSGDIYHDLVPAQEESAVEALLKLSKKYEGQLTVITIGTLTNVALAIQTDPEFLNRLEHLFIGASHIHGPNNPEPEYNAKSDVEAYKIVMENASPEKVTLFPSSQVKKYLNFAKEWRENVLGALDTEIIKHQNKFEKVSLQRDEKWQALDPATVAMYLKPEFVEEYKYSICSIITYGDRRGITTHDLCDKTEANVRIIYSVKTEPYKQFLIDIFSPR